MVIKKTESFYNRQVFRPVLDDAYGQISCLCFTNLGGLLPSDRFRKLNHFVLLYVFDGEGFYSDSTGYHAPIYPGTLCIIPPNLEHTYYTSQTKSWDEIHVHFQGELFDNAYENELFGSGDKVFMLEPVKRWARRFADVMEDENPLTKAVAQREACAFLSVLCEASYHAIHAYDSSQRDWLSQAKDLLRADPEDVLDLQDVASQMGLSYERFRKRFTELAEESPGRYRKHRIMEEAAQLLLGTDLTHAEIADRLNFADEYHFSQRFKLVMGEAPKSFRRRYTIPT